LQFVGVALRGRRLFAAGPLAVGPPLVAVAVLLSPFNSCNRVAIKR
jgi:hypothetical protein